MSTNRLSWAMGLASSPTKDAPRFSSGVPVGREDGKGQHLGFPAVPGLRPKPSP